jgi:predicted DNA-binding transcriptional regulator AlpA
LNRTYTAWEEVPRCIRLTHKRFHERTTLLIPTRLGTRDAAAYLGGISEDTLRYWRYEGTGPRSYRLGRRCYYDVADLDAWVAEQKAATAVGGVK